MNLTPLIAELLKTNYCVIVPDFGGFIANYLSSGFDERGDLFSPPSKEIIFSSKLRKNDGLLVNFVGEQMGVGYLEARKIVAEFVAETTSRLENGETIEFSPVGTIRMDQQENYLFEADQQINFRADTFGLESYHFPQLVAKHHLPPKTVFRDLDPAPQKRRYPAIKYLVAALPILVLLYFVPVRKILNYGEKFVQPQSNNASLSVTDSPVDLHSKTTPASVNTEPKNGSSVPEENVGNNPSPTSDSPSVKTGNALPELTPSQNSGITSASGKYQIVGGCFKIKQNADNLAEKLVGQGYPAEVSKLGKEFYKVTVISYENRGDAEAGLAKILEADPVTGYWLKVDKN